MRVILMSKRERPLILFPLMTIGSICVFIGLLIVSSFVLFSSSEEDVKEYEKLMQNSDPNKANKESPVYTAKQQRQGSNKEILYSKGDSRLKLRICSRHAELVLDHREEKTEIIENMHGVVCSMQEELYYALPNSKEPMQVIRYLEADEAIYRYKTDTFTAERVRISRYVVPGHELVENFEGVKPLMSGIAKKIEFSLSGEDLNFTAHGLKATLNGRKEG